MASSKTEERIDLSNGPQPIRGDRGASILGPRNVPVERENPDLLRSPSTDAGTIPNLKFSFAAARNRITPGGWGREVTAASPRFALPRVFGGQQRGELDGRG